MTEHNETQGSAGQRWDPDREDILIGRVTDGEASPSDWNELEQLAGADPQLWVRLAQSQRAHARFARVVDERVSLAELVELPEAPTYQIGLWQRVARYGGWAAAAALAIGWGFNGVPGPGQMAGLGSVPEFKSPTADEAYADYLRAGMAEGRVLGELTPQVIDTQPAQNGAGYETVIVRQIVERLEVTGAMELRVTVNELGGEDLVRRPAPLGALRTGIGSGEAARPAEPASKPIIRPGGPI